MMPFTFKTYLTILATFIPACNGELLLASWSESNGSTETSGEGGSGGNDQGGSDQGNGGMGGSGGSERECFCKDLLDNNKCDDKIANEKFLDFYKCACTRTWNEGEGVCNVLQDKFCKGENVTWDMSSEFCFVTSGWQSNGDCKKEFNACNDDK